MTEQQKQQIQEGAVRYLVIRKRDTEPIEAYPFAADEQQEALAFYDAASAQWSETFLCLVAEPSALSALASAEARAAEAESAESAMRTQRDDLSDEMERCHRMLDVHYGESLETTSLDTLEDRLEQLLAEVAPAEARAAEGEAERSRLDEMRRLYERVGGHMECCNCPDCRRFRELAEGAAGLPDGPCGCASSDLKHMPCAADCGKYVWRADLGGNGVHWRGLHWHLPCAFTSALSALSTAERRAAAWRPIETAPRDGTPVLLVWHWDSGIHTGVNVVEAAWTCRSHNHSARRHDCPNEADCDMGWDHYGGTMTHWMPLPDPPAGARQGGQEGE